MSDQEDYEPLCIYSSKMLEDIKREAQQPLNRDE